MEQWDWRVVGPLLGVVLAPLFTYLVARRKTSGRIDTTEAATLWAEADRMRTIYRDEALSLRAELLGVRAEVSALRVEIKKLHKEIAVLQKKLANEKKK